LESQNLYLIRHDYTGIGEGLETSVVLKKMHRRIIKNFLDVLVLAELRNGPMSGYDVIAFIHNKFRLLVSSGTVYSLLYSLERDELISGSWNQRKRVYKLTDKGEETIKAIMNANDKIQYLMTSLLKVSK
jgi:DNA-binding PadR family transcriptional regulator